MKKIEDFTTEELVKEIESRKALQLIAERNISRRRMFESHMASSVDEYLEELEKLESKEDFLKSLQEMKQIFSDYIDAVQKNLYPDEA